MPTRLVREPDQIGPTAEQVRRQLLDQIRSGALHPGQRLGTERCLAVELGVSRSSLRQALASLELDGVLRRVPGRSGGQRSSRPPNLIGIYPRIVGVPALLRDQGLAAGSEVMSSAVVDADAATARRLRIDHGAYVYDVVRIRLADSSPISLERVRLPAERFPGLLELSLGGSIYELLEEHLGVQAARSEEHIEVVAAAAEDEGAILGIPPGAPLLSIVRTTHCRCSRRSDRAFAHDLFRADRTRITVHTYDGATVSSSTNRGEVVELRVDST